MAIWSSSPGLWVMRWPHLRSSPVVIWMSFLSLPHISGVSLNGNAPSTPSRLQMRWRVDHGMPSFPRNVPGQVPRSKYQCAEGLLQRDGAAFGVSFSFFGWYPWTKSGLLGCQDGERRYGKRCWEKFRHILHINRYKTDLWTAGRLAQLDSTLSQST